MLHVDILHAQENLIEISKMWWQLSNCTETDNKRAVIVYREITAGQKILHASPCPCMLANRPALSNITDEAKKHVLLKYVGRTVYPTQRVAPLFWTCLTLATMKDAVMIFVVLFPGKESGNPFVTVPRYSMKRRRETFVLKSQGRLSCHV